MLQATPIKQADAFAFIKAHHRHHNVPAGSLFQVAVSDDNGVIRGVAVVGRPVARMLDDGLTIEVTRLCTDGAENACSMLYGLCRRIALEKGFRRGVTYILDSEPGSSLKASGWEYAGEAGGGSWSRPSRGRTDPNPTCKKQRWQFGPWPSPHPQGEREQ